MRTITFQRFYHWPGVLGRNFLWTCPRDVGAIAINPWSDVEALDLCIDIPNTLPPYASASRQPLPHNGRQRISARRPFFGTPAVPQGQVITFAPIRYYPSMSETDIGPDQRPRAVDAPWLMLDIYDVGEPMPQDLSRAPLAYWFSTPGIASSVCNIPVQGRSILSIAGGITELSGASTATVTVTGHDAISDADSVSTTLGTDVLSAGVGMQREYAGAPFDMLRISFVTDAGSANLAFVVNGWDGEL